MIRTPVKARQLLDNITFYQLLDADGFMLGTVITKHAAHIAQCINQHEGYKEIAEDFLKILISDYTNHQGWVGAGRTYGPKVEKLLAEEKNE